MKADRQFYVYEHRRLDTGAIFYVGKGKGARFTNIHNRNPHWRNIAQKSGFAAHIVADGLDEELSFFAEIELIELHLRRGVRLVNMTMGGDGASLTPEVRELLTQKMRDPEVNARRSASLRASWRREGEAEKRKASLRAAYRRPEVLQRLRESNRESNSRPDVRKKISASSKAYWLLPGVKAARLGPLLEASIAVCARPVLCVETGVVFESFSAAVRWLRSTGKEKAAHAAIVHACKGKLKSAYGFKWTYATKGGV